MTEPQTKKCEVCGEIKPLADFSKSYRNRCKPCVAEMRRKSRIVSDMTRKPNDSEYKKARIKQTGEVVEVRPLGFHAKCNIPMFRTKDCREVPQYALQFEPEIDWEQRTFEAALAALTGILSNRAITDCYEDGIMTSAAHDAAIAVRTLIAELQKGDVQ